MRIAYLGNFEPPHSTENEVRKALEHLGHEVTTFQEGTAGLMFSSDWQWQLILWTRTADLSRRVGPDLERRMLLAARGEGIPTVAYHLDKWWGLTENGREDSVWTEPFFRCEHFFSTDGGHDLEWKTAGVNHHWLPPAVSEFECVPGTPRPEYESEIAFIGSWQNYHPEHKHRAELVDWLRSTYGNRVRFWPKPGRPAVRGEALRDLIASCKVIVGDSCLPDGRGYYWSDRVPEVTGRGGFLIHPEVEGLADHHPGVPTWPMGDWGYLRDLIDHFLECDTERLANAELAAAHTRKHHTYTRRMETVLETVT